jgi:hypothetical protein
MTDVEWKELQNVWQQDGLQQRVRRYRLDAWRTVLLEVLFALVSVGFGTVWALRTGDSWVYVWTLTLVMLFAIALSYSIWNRRDALWPSAAAPLDFLSQAELRCTRRLEMLRFMAQFGAAEVIISLFLFWLKSALWLGALVMPVLVAAGYLWFRQARRQVVREAEAIASLRLEMDRDS